VPPFFNLTVFGNLKTVIIMANYKTVFLGSEKSETTESICRYKLPISVYTSENAKHVQVYQGDAM